MKAGRNDPCPCGSGKKYKQCCLRGAEEAAPDELTWRRVRRAIEPLPKALSAEALRRFGEQGFQEARAQFFSFADDEEQRDTSHFDALFFSFFFFDWLPDRKESGLPEAVHGVTVAQSIAARQRLEPLAQRYLEACIAASASFYDVLETRPGAGFRLRDMLSDDEVDVIEKSASRSVERGDAIYAKVVPIEGIRIIECMGPAAIPPVYKPEIIRLRQRIRRRRRQSVDARDGQTEMRSLYLSIAHNLFNPRMPELHNTDGDPLEPHTLIFDVDAPEAAARALSDLTAGMNDSELQYDDNGVFVGAEISWVRAGRPAQKDPASTILGVIRIKGRRLTAEVNSRRRAVALRKLIEDRLGDTVHVRPSVVRSVRAMLSEGADAERDEEQDELAQSPEVQALMTQHMRNHYRTWVDSEIPALGGKTPRAAIRTRDGREAVAALIEQIERNGVRMNPPLDQSIIRELRETLKLKAPD